MTPDDARHGTYAGYEAHKKSGTPQCAPCAEAAYKARKRMRLAGPAWAPLGAKCHNIVCSVPPSALSRATGIARRTLHRLKVEGPTARVRHDTKAKLLRVHAITPIGVTRRLRALAALGWSANAVATRAGVSRESVQRVRNDDGRKYAQAEFAAKVAEVYDEWAMTPAPAGRAATRQRRLAQREGWPPPLAWDDIDNPFEQPTDWAYEERTDRVSQVRELHDQGAGVSEVCRRLHMSRDTLQKWCGRKGLSGLYRDLCAREDGFTVHGNQYTREDGAA